jgi:hypothetical protein
MCVFTVQISDAQLWKMKRWKVSSASASFSFPDIRGEHDRKMRLVQDLSRQTAFNINGNMRYRLSRNKFTMSLTYAMLHYRYKDQMKVGNTNQGPPV